MILTRDPKRSASRWPAVAALILLGVAPIGLFPGILDGEVVYPAGVLTGTHEPWVSMAPAGSVEPANPLLSDPVYQFLPWNRLARRSGGPGPGWNPYGGAGAPFVGNPQAAVFDPLGGLCSLASERTGPSWRAWLRLVVAGWLALGFLRAQSVGWLAAMLGAIGFQLGGFLVPWLGHPHAGAALWLPGMLWAGDAVWRGVTGATLTLAVVYAAQFLAGHPETSLHLTAIAGLFLAVRRGWGGWRRWVRMATALAGGALLAAPMLLPFIDYLGRSAALASRAGGAEQPLPWAALGTLALPRGLGWPVDGGAWRASLNANECVAYIGVLPWVAAPFAFVGPLRRLAIALTAVALVCAAVMLGVPGVADAVHALPGFRWAANRRLLLGVAFVGAALGAIGLDALRRGTVAPRRAALIATAAAFALGAVGMTATSATALGEWAWFGGLALAAIAVVVLCIRVRSAGFGAIAILLVDLLAAWSGYQPTAGKHDVHATTPAAEALRAAAGPGDRVVGLGVRGRGLVFPPNTLHRFGLGQLHNYDALGDTAHAARVDRGIGAIRVGAPTSGLAPFGARFLALPTTWARYASTARLVTGEEMFVAFASSPHTIAMGIVVDSYLVETGLRRGEPVATLTIRTATGPTTTIDRDVVLRVGMETADCARPDSLVGSAVRVQRAMLVRDHQGEPHARFVYRASIPLTGRPIGVRLRCTSPNTLLEIEGIGLGGLAGCPTLDTPREPRSADELFVYDDPSAWPRAMMVLRGRIAEPFPASPGPAPGRPAEITVYEPDRVVVEGVARPGELLVLTDAWHHGWRARVESLLGGDSWPAEIGRAFDAFRAVPVPKGPFRVEFSYSSPGLPLGGLLAALAGCLLIGATGIAAWRRRRAAKSTWGIKPRCRFGR